MNFYEVVQYNPSLKPYLWGGVTDKIGGLGDHFNPKGRLEVNEEGPLGSEECISWGLGPKSGLHPDY